MDTQNRLSSNDHALGRVLDRRNEKFDRLQRRINSIQRNYLHALKELQNLEKTESAADRVGQALPPAIPADVPVPIQPESNQQPIPEIGFVPETPDTQAEPVGQALPPANSSAPPEPAPSVGPPPPAF
jgi:hypothetical protein